MSVLHLNCSCLLRTLHKSILACPTGDNQVRVCYLWLLGTKPLLAENQTRFAVCPARGSYSIMIEWHILPWSSHSYQLMVLRLQFILPLLWEAQLTPLFILWLVFWKLGLWKNVLHYMYVPNNHKAKIFSFMNIEWRGRDLLYYCKIPSFLYFLSVWLCF